MEPRERRRDLRGARAYRDLVHGERCPKSEATAKLTRAQTTGKPRGQAYGVHWFRGMREDVVRPIRSAHKKEWYVAEEPTDREAVAKKLVAELKFVAPRGAAKDNAASTAQ